MKTGGLSEFPGGISSDVAPTVLLDSAQRQLEALRETVDLRLGALEEVLSDPHRTSSLESLILDLSRLATEEAQTTAARACVGMRLDAEAQIAKSRKGFQASLEQEQQASREVRQALETAQASILALTREKQSELQSLKEQYEAALRKERSATSELEQMAADLEKSLAAARKDVASEHAALSLLRNTLNESEAANAALTRTVDQLKVDAGQAASEVQRALQQLAGSEKAHAETQAQLAAERASASELRASLERAKETFAGELRREQEAALAMLQREKEEAAAALRRERDQAGEALAAAKDRYSDELQHERRRLADLERAHQDATAGLSAEQSGSVALQGALDQAQQQARAAMQQAQELRASADALALELHHARERISDLQRENSEAAGRLESEREQTEKLKAEVERGDERLAAVGNGEKQAAAAYDALQKELDRERQRRDEIERAHKVTADDLQTVRAQCDDLRRSLADASARLSQQPQVPGGDVVPRAEFDAATVRAEQANAARAEGERTIAGLRVTIENVSRERDRLVRDLQGARQPAAPAAAPPLVIVSGLAESVAPPRDDKRTVKGRKKTTADTAPAEPSSAPHGAPKSVTEDGWTAVAMATRYSFTNKLDVQVNGHPGWLCDLSTTGCQILAPGVLKPGQSIKLQIPNDPIIHCAGKVVWAQLEPPASGRALAYRAGVQFTKVDEAIVERFNRNHGVPS